MSSVRDDPADNSRGGQRRSGLRRGRQVEGVVTAEVAKEVRKIVAAALTKALTPERRQLLAETRWTRLALVLAVVGSPRGSLAAGGPLEGIRGPPSRPGHWCRDLVARLCRPDHGGSVRRSGHVRQVLRYLPMPYPRTCRWSSPLCGCSSRTVNPERLTEKVRPRSRAHFFSAQLRWVAGVQGAGTTDAAFLASMNASDVSSVQ